MDPRVASWNVRLARLKLKKKDLGGMVGINANLISQWTQGVKQARESNVQKIEIKLNELEKAAGLCTSTQSS